MSTSMKDAAPAGREIIVPGEHVPAHAPQHDEQDATALVRLALDKNVSVDVIERLVALQERMADRSARAAYFEALAAFQDECPEIAKSKTASIAMKSGGNFKYTYAPLDVVARTIRPVLKKHGLSYNFNVRQDGGSLIIDAIVRHIDGHSETSSFPVPIDKGSRMSDAQANGAALTYGKRQALVAALGLTTADVDNDARARRNPDEEQLISEEEVAALDDTIESLGKAVDRKKFLSWLGYERLSDIPRHELARAQNALKEKQARSQERLP